MKVNVEKQPGSQIKINVVVPKEKVKESYTKVLNEKIKTTTVDGFRPGNAPKDKVIQKIGVSAIYGDVINRLLEIYYPQAAKEKFISPISSPKIEIKEFNLEKDFEFEAVVAVKPTVKVGDFKKPLITYYNKKKKENEKAKLNSGEVIEEILKQTECEIPQLLIEEEANKMLARLINQAQAVGMSLKDYLTTQNKTAEDLKKEYKNSANKTIKAEFALSDLVKKANIEISDKEVETAIRASGAKDVETQLSNPIQKVYIKSVLEKNKLIMDIIEEIENAK